MGEGICALACTYYVVDVDANVGLLYYYGSYNYGSYYYGSTRMAKTQHG